MDAYIIEAMYGFACDRSPLTVYITNDSVDAGNKMEGITAEIQRIYDRLDKELAETRDVKYRGDYSPQTIESLAANSYDEDTSINLFLHKIPMGKVGPFGGFREDSTIIGITTVYSRYAARFEMGEFIEETEPHENDFLDKYEEMADDYEHKIDRGLL